MGKSRGSFSRRTLEALSVLDKTDAQLFTALCGFCCFDPIHNTYVPFILDCGQKTYMDGAVNYGTLLRLNDIGLINFNSIETRLVQNYGNYILDKYMMFRECHFPFDL